MLLDDVRLDGHRLILVDLLVLHHVVEPQPIYLTQGLLLGRQDVAHVVRGSLAFLELVVHELALLEVLLLDRTAAIHGLVELRLHLVSFIVKKRELVLFLFSLLLQDFVLALNVGGILIEVLGGFLLSLAGDDALEPSEMRLDSLDLLHSLLPLAALRRSESVDHLVKLLLEFIFCF